MASNGSILYTYFPRKYLCTVPYHALWYMRVVSIEILSRLYEPDALYIALPFRIMLYYVNKMMRNTKRLPQYIKGTPWLVASPRALFFRVADDKNACIAQLEEYASNGLSLIGDVIGIEGSMLVGWDFRDDACIYLEFEGACRELFSQVLLYKEPSECVNKDVLEPPIDVYKKYPVRYPFCLWDFIMNVEDIIALSYLNTLFLHGEYNHIPHYILNSTLLRYFTPRYNHNGRKIEIINKMNLFCHSIGLPGLFDDYI